MVQRDARVLAGRLIQRARSMISVGEGHSGTKAYERALRFSRKMYLDVRILDNNERQIATLHAPHSLIIDGQVDVDSTQAVTRSLRLNVVDPQHHLYLDPASPHKTALFPGQLIRVIRWDFVHALGRYVGAPVFWGPITHFSRQGHEVS